MPNYLKIQEQNRKAALSLDGTAEFIRQNGWVFIPFIVSGVQNYTNRGFVNRDINPDDAETFKRVWSGNDSCSIIWENSTTLINKNGVNTLSYQLGKYAIGSIHYNSSALNTKKDTSYSEYVSDEIMHNINATFDAADYAFSNYDMLKFWKIPKFSGQTLYRITNIHRIFNENTRQIKQFEISFEAINQTYANTGRARQQNINMGQPGQGYLNPMVMDSNWNTSGLLNGIDYIALSNGEYLTANRQLIKHNPIVKAVVKIFGSPFVNYIKFVGRPVYSNTDYTFTSLRDLFMMNWEQPQTPTLFRTSQNSNNYYAGSLKPVIIRQNDALDALKKWVGNVVVEYQWDAYMIDEGKRLPHSNPQLSDGTYTYPIYNSMTSNPTQTTITPWMVDMDEETINTPNSYGVAYNYQIQARKAAHDRMMDFYYILKTMSYIPITINETITFGSMFKAGLASGVVGMFSKKSWTGLFGVLINALLFGIGLIGTLANKSRPIRGQKVFGLMNAPIYDIGQAPFANTFNNDGILPFGYFRGDDKLSQMVFGFQNSYNFAIQGQLTDAFETNYNGTKYTLSTSSIGQANQMQYANGSMHTINGLSMLMDGAQTLTPNIYVGGYIIDQVVIGAVCEAEISIEFLDSNDEVVWSGVYQSESKWTKNIREHVTVINTSILNNGNILTQKMQPYPSTLITPMGNTDTLEPTTLYYNNHDLMLNTNVNIGTYIEPETVTLPYWTGFNWVNVTYDYSATISTNSGSLQEATNESWFFPTFSYPANNSTTRIKLFDNDLWKGWKIVSDNYSKISIDGFDIPLSSFTSNGSTQYTTGWYTRSAAKQANWDLSGLKIVCFARNGQNIHPVFYSGELSSTQPALTNYMVNYQEDFRFRVFYAIAEQAFYIEVQIQSDMNPNIARSNMFVEPKRMQFALNTSGLSVWEAEWADDATKTTPPAQYRTSHTLYFGDVSQLNKPICFENVTLYAKI